MPHQQKSSGRNILIFLGIHLFCLSGCRAQVINQFPESPINSPTLTIGLIPTLTQPPRVETQAFSQSAQEPPKALSQVSSTFWQDVPFCSSNGYMQKLDLYHPKASSPPYQLLVYIHGGGWTSGDKNNAIHLPETRELLKRGYAVASINYRLAPVHRWPAQIEDCICAIHFLRAHSQVYQIETQKIGVFGTSAGGHLASLLGTMDETIFLQAGDSSQGYSSRVQAVVNMFGPIDFTAGDMADKVTQHQSIFGATSPDDPVLEQASPITHVSADDPPFLILHGEEDGLVPLRQSRSFYERLLHAGVPVELVIVKNAGHGFKSTGEEIQPSRMDIAGIVADFFDKIFVTAQPYQF